LSYGPEWSADDTSGDPRFEVVADRTHARIMTGTC